MKPSLHLKLKEILTFKESNKKLSKWESIANISLLQIFSIQKVTPSVVIIFKGCGKWSVVLATFENCIKEKTEEDFQNLHKPG